MENDRPATFQNMASSSVAEELPAQAAATQSERRSEGVESESQRVNASGGARGSNSHPSSTSSPREEARPGPIKHVLSLTGAAFADDVDSSAAQLCVAGVEEYDQTLVQEMTKSVGSDVSPEQAPRQSSRAHTAPGAASEFFLPGSLDNGGGADVSLALTSVSSDIPVKESAGEVKNDQADDDNGDATVQPTVRHLGSGPLAAVGSRLGVGDAASSGPAIRRAISDNTTGARNDSVKKNISDAGARLQGMTGLGARVEEQNKLLDKMQLQITDMVSHVTRLSEEVTSQRSLLSEQLQEMRSWTADLINNAMIRTMHEAISHAAHLHKRRDSEVDTNGGSQTLGEGISTPFV